MHQTKSHQVSGQCQQKYLPLNQYKSQQLNKLLFNNKNKRRINRRNQFKKRSKKNKKLLKCMPPQTCFRIKLVKSYRLLPNLKLSLKFSLKFSLHFSLQQQLKKQKSALLLLNLKSPLFPSSW